MRLTQEENQHITDALENLRRCLSDELKNVPAVQEGKIKVDDKLLKKISDAYFSGSEGIINLLVDSGLLSSDPSCACVAVCTYATR